jgi:hypothetical protein
MRIAGCSGRSGEGISVPHLDFRCHPRGASDRGRRRLTMRLSTWYADPETTDGTGEASDLLLREATSAATGAGAESLTGTTGSTTSQVASAGALVINVIYDNSTPAGFRAAIDCAVNCYESVFTDSVTVSRNQGL